MLRNVKKTNHLADLVTSVFYADLFMFLQDVLTANSSNTVAWSGILGIRD